MGLDLGDQIQVPGVVAAACLTGEADLAAGLDTGRNLDFQSLLANLDEPRRAVKGFFKGEIDLHLHVLTVSNAAAPGPGFAFRRRPGTAGGLVAAQLPE